MIAPQFSLRSILAVTAVVAVLSLVGQQAWQGYVWAYGVLIGLAAVLALFVIFALLFAVVWVMATVLGSFQSRPTGAAPFATHTPPPQWVPNRE